MNYAMSPSSKRMMVSHQGMNKQSMNNTNYASNQAIPTPSHVSRAKQSPNNGNMNSSGQNSSGQYAQQSNPSNKYRVARKPPQQQNGQQMMYQQ
jgi:hypothetical protein